MKRHLLAFVLIFSFLVPLDAAAAWKYGMPIRQSGNVGIGFGAGTLASLFSIKYFAASDLAFQGNFGWWRNRWGNYKNTYGGRNSFAVSGDALIEMPVLVGNGDIDLAWNFGGGAGVGFSEWNDDLGIAVAGVLGLELLINAIPIDLVLEYRPGFLIIPDFGLDLINFSGHIRFWF